MPQPMSHPVPAGPRFIRAGLAAIMLVVAAPVLAQESAAIRCDALAGDPADPDLIGPGIALEDIDWDAAGAACGEAIAADPTDRHSTYTLARLLYFQARYDEAVPLFLLSAQMGAMASYWYLGEAFQFGVAVEPDLNAAANYYRLGWAAGDPWSALSLGDLLVVRAGLSQEAINAYRFAIDSSERVPSSTAMNNLAFSYALMGENLAEAAVLAQRALETALPEDIALRIGILDSIAFIQLQLGDIRVAAQAMKEALALAPGRADLWDRNGDVLATAGLPAAAAASWRRALEVYAADPEIAAGPGWDPAEVERKLGL